MAVWTVSAELGTGGDLVAAGLAAAADIALVDRDALALLARDLNPDVTGASTIDELEQYVGKGGISLLALGIPFSPLAGDMVRQINSTTPSGARAGGHGHAARQPSVISASGAFAAMEPPGAIHVRLRAPLGCRVARTPASTRQPPLRREGGEGVTTTESTRGSGRSTRWTSTTHGTSRSCSTSAGSRGNGSSRRCSPLGGRARSSGRRSSRSAQPAASAISAVIPSFSRLARSRASAACVLDLTVPSGCSRILASCAWLYPS